MKTPLVLSPRRSSLLVALAAAVLAGCGGGGSHDSSTAGPSIKTQPTSASAVAGSAVTLSVTASGSGLTYQWFKNGSAINGATSSNYTIATVSNANVATYYVTVTDRSGGTIQSNPVTLTLTTSAAPTISTQPTNLTVLPGGSARFTVIASGSGTLTYQWYFNGAAIAGATGATYTISNVADANAGKYYVIVTNASGSVQSTTVSLATSANAPSIDRQPLSQSIATGAKATFTVSATGIGTLTYQWYFNGAAIAGATAATYSITAVSPSDNGSYSVAVSNNFGTTASDAATLTVITAPVIMKQPTGGSVNQGGTLTLTVGASGLDLTYQWFHDGQQVSGATGPSYTITNATSSSGGNYYVIVRNVAGSVSSDTVTVTEVGPPKIISQPSSTTVGLGSTATFTVAATGTGSLTYQWYKNGAAVSGATSASYTTPATTTNDNTATFYVVVSNAAGDTTSSTATLKVDQAPTITTQPQSVTVTAPATAVLTVAATASGTLTYQWYSTTAGLISGATSASYTTPATVKGTSNTYYVVVSNDGVISTTSNQATVTGQ